MNEIWWLSFITFKKGKSKKDQDVGQKQEAYNPDIHHIWHMQLPLYDVEIFAEDGTITISLRDMAKKDVSMFLTKKFHKVLLSCTTDPNIEWAGDWSDMGEYRLVYILQDAKIEKKLNHVNISTRLVYEKNNKVYKNFEKQVHIADREVWFKDE